VQAVLLDIARAPRDRACVDAALHLRCRTARWALEVEGPALANGGVL